MRILAIDTSTKFFCLGILDGAKPYGHILETSVKLSGLIVVIIKRVLDALNLKPQGFDYFACGTGPGSFTGLRVGVAAIKGLSWAVNKPVIGIPTLDILANNFDKDEGFVVPAVDAKRGLIYCCIYEKKKDKIRKLSPYMLLTLDEFCKKVRPSSFILGDVLSVYREDLLKRIKRVRLLDKDYWYPKPYRLLELVKMRIKDKRSISDPFKIKPLYLYPKDCQIRKK